MALHSRLRGTGITLQLTSLQRRCFASSRPRATVATAAEAAASLMERYSGKTIVRRQELDNNQLRKLLITLNRHHPQVSEPVNLEEPISKYQVPPGYHLVYFTPDDPEQGLGADGTDKVFNPPAPFTRRMWAGGRMKWCPIQKLWTGDRVEERTRLLSATPKKSKSGSEMVLVEVEKEYITADGTPVIDERSWIFRPEIDASAVVEVPKLLDVDVRAPTRIEDISGDASGSEYPVRNLRWSPVGLFRFSALTFNGHKIHYNDDWTQKVEGHPGVVVHGPLNLINIIDYWRDVHGKGNTFPSDIQYRASSPIYAGEEYQIKTKSVIDKDGCQVSEILAFKNGIVCMQAIVTGPVSE